jgi:hypothetical protein
VNDDKIKLLLMKQNNQNHNLTNRRTGYQPTTGALLDNNDGLSQYSKAYQHNSRGNKNHSSHDVNQTINLPGLGASRGENNSENRNLFSGRKVALSQALTPEIKYVTQQQDSRQLKSLEENHITNSLPHHHLMRLQERINEIRSQKGGASKKGGDEEHSSMPSNSTASSTQPKKDAGGKKSFPWEIRRVSKEQISRLVATPRSSGKQSVSVK